MANVKLYFGWYFTNSDPFLILVEKFDVGFLIIFSLMLDLSSAITSFINDLTSTFLLCKFFLKKMIKNKSGKIINITSVVGHTGNIGQANYAASKSGIIGMSKSLALEYAKKNININCISPGFIKTNMTEKIDPKFKELILAKIPSNRLGEPSDVANVAAFLSSEMSSYITGETIHVNGGMYLGWQKFFFIY